MTLPAPPANGAEVHTLDADAGPIDLSNARGVVAFERYIPWWTKPTLCHVDHEPVKEAMLLIWQDAGGGLRLLMPLAHGGRRAYLQERGDGWHVVVVGDGDAEPLLVAAGGGDDPATLCENAWKAAAERLNGEVALRRDKPVPPYHGRFGWCTWDAFYGEVSHDKVLTGLQSLREAGLSPGFVILDDGWQDTRDSMLWSTAANAKFPGGLRPTIDAAKSEFGVEQFAVWHTLQGYWAGVHPDGPAAERFDVIDADDTLFHGKNWREHHGTRRCLLSPEHAADFFNAWHRELAEAGVDFVKVDNQGSHESFGGTEAVEVPTAAAYQRALQTSAATHFDRQVMHCMAMTNAVTCHLHTTSAVRNSDDFYPKKPWSHGVHVRNNAFNALWVGPVAWPDWDMFHSRHAASAFHAAARAVSGGPVYVSDKPGEHDATLVSRLLDDAGRPLRSDSPATVAADGLFIDPCREDRLLKIVNRNGDAGVIALFHCRWDGDREEGATNVAGPIADRWSPRDVPGLAGDRFAAYAVNADEVTTLAADDSPSITLAPQSAEVVHVAPILDGIAILGVRGKLNASRAIAAIRRDATGVEIDVTTGGELVLWSDRPLADHAPGRVHVPVPHGGGSVRLDFVV